MKAKSRKNSTDRSKYFDWFVLAGLGMNVVIVLWLLGYWLLH